MKRLLLAGLAVFCTTPLYAGYNATMTGVVQLVVTYTDTDLILIRVQGQPTTHPECTSFDYLAMDPATSESRRQIMLSRLLAAQATKEPIAIGYDNLSGCVGGRIKIYRAG